MTRYFEDFVPGEVIELGSVVVDEAEVIEFARRYDPQPFHLDADAAAASHFGGLIASGWHTCAMCMRLMVDGLLGDSSSQGSPGMDQIRWLAPVRPGDVLSARCRVGEVRASTSRPDRGTVSVATEVTNQDGVVVMTMHGVGMYGRHPGG